MATYKVVSEKYWTGYTLATYGDVIELPQSGLKGTSLVEIKTKAKGSPKAGSQTEDVSEDDPGSDTLA
jgi:hypothetical protein